MKRVPSNRVSSGFTLMEVLLSIAILAILGAIAFPAVSSLQSRMKMSELDAAARGIYVAAQNQLTALRSGGGLSAFDAAQPLSATPDSGDAGSWWQSLRYLSSMDPDASHSASLAALLPAGAIDPSVADGSYVIEFDPSQGDIYAVFYSEQNFTYDSALPRDPAGRSAHTPPLGYYGGITRTTSPAATQLSPPQVEITNGEVLQLTLSEENPFSDVSSIDFFNGLTFLVSIRSASASSSAEYVLSTADPTAPFILDLTGQTYTLVLDSLSRHFYTLCPGITPGDDLRITAAVSYSDEDRVSLPASTAKTVNSLFAARSGAEALVACGRHLQNLEPTVSHVSTITSATQTAHIDWSYANSFVPISNPGLTAYSGSGLPISGLSVGINGNCSGLFGTFSGGDLSHIRLINEKVSGGLYSGGLVGCCSGPTTVSGCSLIVSDVSHASRYTVSGTRFVGGLAGYASSLRISDSFASPGGLNGGSSAGAMGGLVGFCGAGSLVSRCYADTDLTGAADMGGLIGSNGGGAVTDCYALGNLSPTGSVSSGGLVGRGSGSYTNCYAAAAFDGAGSSSSPYGFSGGASGTYSNCICLENSAYSLGTSDGKAGPVSYDTLKSWAGGHNWTATVPANSHPYSEELLQAVASGSAYPFQRLITLEHYNDWPAAPSGPSLPGTAVFCYFETYGDNTTGYYAKDGSGRVILDTLSDSKGTVKYDGYRLLSPDPLIANSNQGQIFYQSSDGQTPGSSGSSIWPNSTLVTLSQGGKSQQYYSYQIPDYIIRLEWGGKYATSNFYQWFYADGQTYWCCPYFAKSAVNGAVVRPAFDGNVIIRSARQLTALACTDARIYWSPAFTFRQELNLDFDTALGEDGKQYWVSSTVGNSSHSFLGTYDGSGLFIRLNHTANSSKPGLFGYNAGTIRNIVLQNSGDYQSGQSNSTSGGLVARNSGTVSHCIVLISGTLSVQGSPYGALVGDNAGTIAGCLVTGSGSASLSGGYGLVGGLVGNNSGVISDSAVRPSVSSYSGLSILGAKAVAGLVYSNTGTITNCFAVGTLSGANDGDSCGAAGFVYSSTGSGTIFRCYANSIVSGYYAAGFARQVDSSARIENCYAMGHVTSNVSWGSAAAAGFLCQTGPGVSSCYAAEQVFSARGSGYAFSGSGTPGANCCYFNWSSAGISSAGTACTLDDLLNHFAGDSGNWGSAATHVFRELVPNLPDVCPFPLLKDLDHYGDWPPIS